MFFLYELEYDIALNHVDHLLALPFELDCIAMRHASFNLNYELLAFMHKSLALAMRAVLCIDPAFSLAVTTRLLHLHLHKAHVYVLDGHALSLAFRTDLFLTSFGTGAFALVAVDVSIDGIDWTVAKV